LLKDDGTWVTGVLKAMEAMGWDMEKAHGIRIRSEKHGALYHIASVEILTDAPSIRLAVTTAVSDGPRLCLAEEYDTLISLNRSHRLPYLPAVYAQGEVTYSKGQTPCETFTLMLSEWFEGYHEWHLSVDPSDQDQRVCIWDLDKGYRYASSEEAFEIYRQASSILTVYYDPHTFRQIYPWRHAAGDFVVKTGDEGVQVRLITVRGYRSIMDFFSDGPVDPLIALTYFFLDLTIGMRLDRLDGVGETVWAPDVAVQATLAGFLESLSIMADMGRMTSEAVRKLRSLLQSLDRDDLGRLHQPLLAFYAEERPDESRVIQARLEAHISSLHQALQKSPG